MLNSLYPTSFFLSKEIDSMRSKIIYVVVALLTLTIGVSLTLIRLRRDSSIEVGSNKSEQKLIKTPQIVAVKGGTKFGFCMIDCNEEVTIENTKAQFILSSNDRSKYPDKKREGKLTGQEWESLLQLVDNRALMALPKIIGCPDCGDGGAEWVEVVFDDGTSKRIVYEYNDQPQQIKALAEKLAVIRKLYAKQLRKQNVMEK
jgi:hypothetical protein